MSRATGNPDTSAGRKARHRTPQERSGRQAPHPRAPGTARDPACV